MVVENQRYCLAESIAGIQQCIALVQIKECVWHTVPVHRSRRGALLVQVLASSALAVS